MIPVAHPAVIDDHLVPLRQVTFIGMKQNGSVGPGKGKNLRGELKIFKGFENPGLVNSGIVFSFQRNNAISPDELLIPMPFSGLIQQVVDGSFIVAGCNQQEH